MRRHHTGSGTRTAVPVDWDSAFGALVTVQWQTDATVILKKPGGVSAWSETAGRMVTTPFPPFTAELPARITALTADSPVVVDEQVWVLGYRVSIPADTAPTTEQLDEGIEVVVRRCSDPMLEGMVMRVSEVVRGVHRFERELIVKMNS